MKAEIEMKFDVYLVPAVWTESSLRLLGLMSISGSCTGIKKKIKMSEKTGIVLGSFEKTLSHQWRVDIKN